MDGAHHLGQPVTQTAAFRRPLGYLLVGLAAICFGLIPLIGRAAFADGMTPEISSLARYIAPAICFAPALRHYRGGRRSALLLFFGGMAMGIGVNGYMWALRTLDVAAAVLIFFTYPLFTIILARLIFGVRLTPPAICSVALVLGAAVLGLRGDSLVNLPLTAVAYAFMAPVAYGAIIAIFAECAPDLPPWPKIALSGLGAACGAAPIALLSLGQFSLPQTVEGIVADIGLLTIAGIVPQMLLVIGAPMIGAAATAIIGSLELIVALATGWFTLGEDFETTQAMSAVLILLAIAATAVMGRRGRKNESV